MRVDPGWFWVGGAAVGLLLLVALFLGLRWLWRRWRDERDPLPERDPKCVWYSEVTRLDRVYDGDTFYAHVKGHQTIDGKPTAIRIRGLDTPEMKDKRPAVRKKAEAAKALLEERLRRARKVHLYNISLNDKYGRMLATVFCDHTDMAREMRRRRLGRAYDGGTKKGW
jgi:endonuclease YncB( thermonuclease family)